MKGAPGLPGAPLRSRQNNHRFIRCRRLPRQDTVAISAFFPQNARIHQVESVTWKIDSDEIHTVAFMSPEDPLPAFPALIPGGGPTNLMLNPAVAFKTRLPSAPVETCNGAGIIKLATTWAAQSRR